MKANKFWEPPPGEVTLRMLVSDGTVIKYWNKHEHGTVFTCTSDGTFDTSLQCLGCAPRTGIFVAALMTLFLKGSDAAKAYYKSRSGE